MLLKLSYPDKKTEVPVRPEEKPVAAARNESHKFVGDVIWVGLGQLFMSLTGLVVLPALTKSYPTQIYGMWSQMVVTVGFLRILTMKFESATIRFLAAEEDKDKRRQALGTMLWPIVAIICIMLLFSMLLRQDLSVLLFTDAQFVDYIPLVLLWASLEALFFFSLSYQRARGKIKRFATVRLALALVRMLVIVYLALAGYSFFWLIVSVIVIQGLFAAGSLIMIFLELGFLKFKLAGLKEYLVYSLPMLPGEVLFWVISVSDRYFITHILNISQTGIYSASCALANLLMLLSFPIGMVLFPAVSRLWETGEPEKVKNYFRYSIKFYLTLAIPAAVGLYILSQPLLAVLATSEFEAGGLLVLLLAAGVTFAGVFMINEYTIYLVKRTAWLPLINAAGAIINVGINIVLIPRMGIMGAAISTLVSYFIITVIIVVWGRKNVAYSIDFVFILKAIVATALMTASLWFLEVESVPGIILAIVIGVAVYGLSLFLLRAFSREDRKIIKNVVSGRGTRTGTD